ncbi:hypothetical protein [Beijerinckia mobilis]|uniref:hypothetical protein n=1 Tax=Beijerinckia mobilis TaxID=231434 RepID=UPI0005533C39|nr:hypothetical protein [Beijerinckia mobilis]
MPKPTIPANTRTLPSSCRSIPARNSARSQAEELEALAREMRAATYATAARIEALRQKEAQH